MQLYPGTDGKEESLLVERGKKISILLGIVCGIFLIFVWGASLFLESRFSQDFFLDLINDSIPGHITFEKMELAVFAGQVDMEGLLIRGPNREKLARVEKVSLNLSWIRLLSGEIRLSSIFLDSPAFDLSLSEEGSFNLLSAFVFSGPSRVNKKDSHEIPLNILANEFVLNKGTIRFKMPGSGLDLLAEGMDILISDANLFNESARLSLNVKTGNMTYQGREEVVVEPFRIQADLKGGGLDNIFIQTNTRGVDMEIQGRIKNVFTTPFLDLTLGAGVALEQAARAGGMEKMFPRGKIQADLSVKGSLDFPEVKAALLSESIEFNKVSIRNFALYWEMKEGVVTMLPSGLSSNFGNLSMDGEMNLNKAFPKGFQAGFDLNELFYGVNAALDGLPLSALDGMSPSQKGLLTGRIKFAGKGIVPEQLGADITASITATNLWVEGMPEPMEDINILVDMNLDRTVAGIKSIRLDTPGIVMTGQGRVDIPARHLSCHLDLGADDLGLLDRLTRVRGGGRGRVSMDIDGPFLSPTVSLSATGSNLKINEFFAEKLNLLVGGRLGDPIAKGEIAGQSLFFNQTRLGDARAIMGFANGILELESFQLAQGKSLISGEGRLGILDENFALISDPDIQLALTRGSVFLEDFFENMTGCIFLGGKVQGHPSDLEGILTADGNFLGIGDGNEDGDGEQVNGGVLSLNLAAGGSVNDLVVNGRLGIQKLVILGEDQNPVDLVIEFKNRRLGIKGDMEPAIEGRYDLDTGLFMAVLDMDDLNLFPYFSLMGQSQFTGAITGRVRVEGRAGQPEQIRGSGDFPKIMIDFADKPFIRIEDAGLAFEEGQLQLLPTQVSLLEKSRITVKGQGDMGGDHGGKLDFEARGEIPLGLVNSLVKEVESATGVVRVHAFLKGSLADPRFFWDFGFDGLGLSVDGLEQDFKNMEGRVRVTPDKIEILGVKGYLDQGRFDLGGSVTLEEGTAKTVDLKMNAHQLNFDIPDLMEVSLNCSLNLAGRRPALDLTGEITLLGGRYHKDVELNLLTAATQRTREIKPLEEKKWEFLQTIGLNVHISRRDPLLVDNNLAYLEVSPDVTIKGTGATPILVGRAQVDSGRIHFQQAEFEVKKGVIDFINPYKIEPSIEIEGETEIRDWTITLAVSGTPDNLEFKFSSNPPEQHADILSLIAFGKTTRELRTADNGGGFAPEQLLARMAADSLQKSLKDATGLEHIEINTTDTQNFGSDGVNLSVGTDLSRQISIKYGVDVRNGETVQRVTTYYHLLEHLLMSGYQDTGGKFGGELKYRLEFR